MILNTSPNGKLRLRKMKNGKGVVEIQLTETLWQYCVWKSLPLNEAEKLFNNQVQHHQEI